MNIQHIIQAAIPNATEDICEHVLWGRTPYPFAEVSAQSLYRAAYSLHRAKAQNKRLCDFCNRLAIKGKYLCDSCDKAISNGLQFNKGV